jgi:hypothetical protein
MIDLKQYQVVQINPETCKNPMFAACLFIVDEIKTWGVQGYVQSLGQNNEPGGQAYYRATWEEIVELNEDGTVPYAAQ